MSTSDESDNVSIKLLLKQVYTLHNSKVKELENEVKDLKEKLLEKEKQLDDAQSNCKKCSELEEVIKSCKATLHEQSKLFENLGQKFSVFNNSEKEQFGNQISPNRAVGVQDSVSPKNEETKNNFKDEKTLVEQSCQSLCFTDTVANVKNIKQNLLQNVMIDTLEESLGLGSITNPSTLMANDSLILAPDTLDIDINVKAEISKNFKKPKNVKQADLPLKQYFKEQNSFIESTKDSSATSTRKRLSSESCADKAFKKCKKEIDPCTKGKENECSKTLIPKSRVNDISSYNLRNTTKSEVSKAESTKMSCNTKEVLLLETAQKNDSSEKQIKNSKKPVDSPFSTMDCSKENANLASPSLLPLSTNHNPVNDTADSDDFQPSCSKYKESGSLKDINDKKKNTTKKVQCVKSVKTSSKYKMTLDAPPLDYKKPNYRQTKLSKTIFQPHCSKKTKNTALEKPLLKKEMNVESEDDDIVITSPTLHEVQNFRSKQESKTMDFDATCIPENFKFEFTPCGKLSSKQLEQNKLSFDESILIFDNKSENKILKLPCVYEVPKQSPKSAEETGRNADSPCEDEDHDAKENMNSFDKLPLPEEPKYKYKEETVRKKADRRQLVGYECKECEKYFSDLGLSEKEKQQRLKKCSRHRAKFVPPSTPEHFWELDFPDTQECKTRGYLNATQKMKLNFLTS